MADKPLKAYPKLSDHDLAVLCMNHLLTFGETMIPEFLNTLVREKRWYFFKDEACWVWDMDAYAHGMPGKTYDSFPEMVHAMIRHLDPSMGA